MTYFSAHIACRQDMVLAPNLAEARHTEFVLSLLDCQNELEIESWLALSKYVKLQYI